MVEIVLDGQSMISDDFFAQFFEAEVHARLRSSES